MPAVFDRSFDLPESLLCSKQCEQANLQANLKLRGCVVVHQLSARDSMSFVCKFSKCVCTSHFSFVHI